MHHFIVIPVYGSAEDRVFYFFGITYYSSNSMLPCFGTFGFKIKLGLHFFCHRALIYIVLIRFSLFFAGAVGLLEEHYT